MESDMLPTVQERLREELIASLLRRGYEHHQITRQTAQHGRRAPPTTILKGLATEQSPELGAIEYRLSITLKDGDDLLLQRLVPESAAQQRLMETSASEGRRHLETMLKKACDKPIVSHPSKKYELGGVYSEGSPYLSNQTAQEYCDKDDETNAAARDAVAGFCEWFDYYAERFVRPLINNEGSTLHKDFRVQLRERIQQHFPFVAEQIPGIERLCRPFFSTFTPSKGFDLTPIEVDSEAEQHATPSVLLNFGDKALLHLPDYNYSIELHPLDIVVYNCEKLKVKAIQPANTVSAQRRASAQRWSVACYFLRSFVQRELPEDDIYARIDRKRRQREEQEPEYFNPEIKQEQTDQAADSNAEGEENDVEEVRVTATRRVRPRRS